MTYGEFIRLLLETADNLRIIDAEYDHYKWSADDLQYEAAYLTRHTDPDEEML